MAIDIGTFNPAALLILAIPLFIMRRRGHGIGFLACFALFFLYLWATLSYTIFPIRLDTDYIEAMRQNRGWASNVNFVPLTFPGDLRSVQVYGNILLGVPWGFGLPFVVKSTTGRVLQLGFCFAAGLELLQLGIGLLYGFPYRVIDIDDVLLVFAGVICGHLVLQTTARVYRRILGTRVTRSPLWGHIHSVLLGVAKNPTVRTNDPA